MIMTSLKLLLLACITTVYGYLPASAETANTPTIERAPATALGQALKPSITLFSPEGDLNSIKMPDLNLQMSAEQPLQTIANPNIWESKLLDEQRRATPGFLKITAD